MYEPDAHVVSADCGATTQGVTNDGRALSFPSVKRWEFLSVEGI